MGLISETLASDDKKPRRSDGRQKKKADHEHRRYQTGARNSVDYLIKVIEYQGFENVAQLADYIRKYRDALREQHESKNVKSDFCRTAANTAWGGEAIPNQEGTTHAEAEVEAQG